MSAEIWKPQSREVYLGWIDALSDVGEDLNTWESNFVNSIYDQLMCGRILTELQAEKLEFIYTEKTP